MSNIFFSIIIPSLNEEINLPILLKSIAEQTFKDFEVVVVDSGSTYNTKEKVAIFKNTLTNFHFIEHKCRNVSVARNYGASKASGKYLIFLDADVEIEQQFLYKIKEKIDLYKLDDLTVWNRPKDAGFTGKFILALMNYNMSLFQNIKPAANGPCIIIRNDLFARVGGFDESIVFGEDFYLIQKAHQLKAKFAVFTEPYLYVSARRFEKEGLIFSLYKSIKAIFYQLFFGPIRKPLFKYEMGGQYYDDKNTK